MQAIIFTLTTFFSTLLGGLFGIKHKDHLHYLMSFTAGVLIAVSFFDILPEIFRVNAQNSLDITPSMMAIVFGFLFFHILEKSILIHHGHDSEYVTDQRHPTIGLVSGLGLSFHSFLDGVGIGLGFGISPHLGVVIAIAVIAHDFSDGLNTVTLMLLNKNSVKKAVVLLLIDATAPVLGALSTILFKIPQHFLVIYLGFFLGFLLYIGASDLLPEAHSKHSSYKLIGLTLLGILFIFSVTRFT